MEGVSGRRVSIKTGGQPRERQSPSGQEDQQPLGRGQPQAQGLDSGLGGVVNYNQGWGQIHIVGKPQDRSST